MPRRLVLLIVLILLAQARVLIAGQSSPTPSTPTRPTTPVHAPGASPRSDTARSPGAAAAASDQTPSPGPPQQIIVSSPPPPPEAWSWHDRIAWGAGILLAVLGYVGIMMGLRTLKHIDHNLELSAANAHAAAESAHAALALAQAIANSERPWIVVTVEPFLTMENSFKVMASNRGRSPARIISTLDQVRITSDEKSLPKNPELEQPKAGEEPEPIVLLPGEATGIWALNRDDLPSICKTPEVIKKVERWQETLFLYGRIQYMELDASSEKTPHVTFWCCRYIHGEKSSALVMAGPPEYNKHT